MSRSSCGFCMIDFYAKIFGGGAKYKAQRFHWLRQAKPNVKLDIARTRMSITTDIHHVALCDIIFKDFGIRNLGFRIFSEWPPSATVEKGNVSRFALRVSRFALALRVSRFAFLLCGRYHRHAYISRNLDYSKNLLYFVL